jgi:hypothetical protein
MIFDTDTQSTIPKNKSVTSFIIPSSESQHIFKTTSTFDSVPFSSLVENGTKDSVYIPRYRTDETTFMLDNSDENENSKKARLITDMFDMVNSDKKVSHTNSIKSTVMDMVADSDSNEGSVELSEKEQFSETKDLESDDEDEPISESEEQDVIDSNSEISDDEDESDVVGTANSGEEETVNADEETVNAGEESESADEEIVSADEESELADEEIVSAVSPSVDAVSSGEETIRTHIRRMDISLLGNFTENELDSLDSLKELINFTDEEYHNFLVICMGFKSSSNQIAELELQLMNIPKDKCPLDSELEYMIYSICVLDCDSMMGYLYDNQILNAKTMIMFYDVASCMICESVRRFFTTKVCTSVLSVINLCDEIYDYKPLDCYIKWCENSVFDASNLEEVVKIVPTVNSWDVISHLYYNHGIYTLKQLYIVAMNLQNIVTFNKLVSIEPAIISCIDFEFEYTSCFKDANHELFRFLMSINKNIFKSVSKNIYANCPFVTEQGAILTIIDDSGIYNETPSWLNREVLHSMLEKCIHEDVFEFMFFFIKLYFKTIGIDSKLDLVNQFLSLGEEETKMLINGLVYKTRNDEFIEESQTELLAHIINIVGVKARTPQFEKMFIEPCCIFGNVQMLHLILKNCKHIMTDLHCTYSLDNKGNIEQVFSVKIVLYVLKYLCSNGETISDMTQTKEFCNILEFMLKYNTDKAYELIRELTCKKLGSDKGIVILPATMMTYVLSGFIKTPEQLGVMKNDIQCGEMISGTFEPFFNSPHENEVFEQARACNYVELMEYYIIKYNVNLVVDNDRIMKNAVNHNYLDQIKMIQTYVPNRYNVQVIEGKAILSIDVDKCNSCLFGNKICSAPCGHNFCADCVDVKNITTLTKKCPLCSGIIKGVSFDKKFLF